MFTKEVGTFQFLDMRVAITRSAQWGSVGLVVLFTLLAVFFTELTPLDSLIAGILAMILHWFSDLVHQYGHFWMARRIGYPSSGLRLWLVLSTTLYTQPEDKVPPRMHIRRALGGSLFSGVFFVLLLPLAALLYPLGGMARFLIVIALVLNGLVFGLGALFPLSIGTFSTDGATILRWMQRSKR